MLVKVSCPCGPRFAFDVEPVNGQMPVTVNCPSCGSDNTHLANAAITQSLAPAAAGAPATAEAAPGIALKETPTPPVAPAPEPSFGLKIKGHSGPAPVTPFAPPPAPAPAAPKPAGLTIGGKSTVDLTAGHKPAPPPPAASSSGSTPAAESPVPAPGGFKPLGGSSHVSGGYIPKEGPEASFLYGVGGGFAGAAAGALLWYAIYHFGEIDFGWCALLPALLAGGGTRWLGKQDNTNLGILAAVFTLMAIFGVRYAIASVVLDKEMKKAVPVQKSYDEYLAEAKLAVEAKTDEEIMVFLRKRDQDEFERRAANAEKEGKEGAKKKTYPGLSVPRDMIYAFRDYGVKEYQELLNGKPSRQEYEESIKVEEKTVTWGMRIAAAFAALLSIGIFGLFATVFSLGVAYKVGSG